MYWHRTTAGAFRIIFAFLDMMHTIKVGSQKLHKQLHSYKLHMYF
uniref:Uncharacterized protein n=1 Tax=Anguilla anguilla TaxID=7936 RepID=A0A0E9PPT8_ANGAN